MSADFTKNNYEVRLLTIVCEVNILERVNFIAFFVFHFVHAAEAAFAKQFYFFVLVDYVLGVEFLAVWVVENHVIVSQESQVFVVKLDPFFRIND